MIVGFTGTRKGMTDEQHRAACAWVKAQVNLLEFHHGCCLGADAEAWEVITSWARRAVIHAHPSTLRGLTSESALHLANVTLPAKPPLDRNRDIVDASDVLLACPAGFSRERSGTWMTIGYARKQHKRIVIIWPDGSVTEENAP